jgi:hypothetical protein
MCGSCVVRSYLPNDIGWWKRQGGEEGGERRKEREKREREKNERNKSAWKSKRQ